MHRYHLAFSPAFEQSVRELYWYIFFTLQNPISADRIAKKIRSRCQSLSIFPNGYAVRFIRDDVEYRSLHVENYTVIYHVDDTSRTIFIDNIFYSRRNIADLI